MKKFIFLFSFTVLFSFFSFSDEWLDMINDAKNQLPKSMREQVDEAMKDKEIKNFASETKKSFSNALEEITPEEEYYIGRAVAANILSKYKVYESKEGQKYLNKILHALTVFSERPVLFKDYFVVILDSDEINAFATSGGHIMITRGLINCASSEDSLAAVLAHEVGHVLLKHSAKAIKNSRLGGAAAKATGKAILLANDNSEKSKNEARIVSSNIDNAINEMLETGYSKQQEYSADTKALELLYSSGYNPHALDELLNVLKTKSSTSDKSGFGKTHPSPDMRLKNTSLRYKIYPEDSFYKKSEERENRFIKFKNSLK